MARICKAAYRDDLKNFLNYKIADQISSSIESDATILYDNYNIIVAFRGTDGFKDWLINLTVDKVDLGFGKVHRGFYTALFVDNFMQKIDQVVESHKEHRSIIVTGHSYGGALASLYPYFGKIEPNMVVPIASPGVGNSDYRDAYNSKYYDITTNVICGSDIVPTIPPGEMNYRKVGQEMYLLNGKDVPLTKFRSFCRYLKFWRYIKDHNIETYIENTK